MCKHVASNKTDSTIISKQKMVCLQFIARMNKHWLSKLFEQNENKVVLLRTYFCSPYSFKVLYKCDPIGWKVFLQRLPESSHGLFDFIKSFFLINHENCWKRSFPIFASNVKYFRRLSPSELIIQTMMIPTDQLKTF